MTRLKRATIALPLVVVLLGAVVPVLLERDEAVRVSDVEAPEPRVSGRTAGEWAALADDAMEKGRLRKALSCVKTAESVSPGVQYAEGLRAVRTAGRRASEVKRLAGRLLGGPVEHIAFGEGGTVEYTQRSTTVLPGESLWTLARDLVAARRRIPVVEVDDADGAVYAVWDAMTTLNGVRELEVGERILLPLSVSERAALSDAHERDHERLASAAAALAEGRVDDAVELRDEFETALVETTAPCRSFDRELEDALLLRETELSLKRELDLVEGARDALARVPGMPRASKHAERLEALNAARASLSEAEAMRGGVQYADASELVAHLLSEETRFSIAPDGAVVARKPGGVSYTEAARRAVEWFFERELRRSGQSFPHSREKTGDERAWARYLADAASAAARDGIDFTALLEAVDDEVELSLPNPVAYFAD